MNACFRIRHQVPSGPWEKVPKKAEINETDLSGNNYKFGAAQVLYSKDYSGNLPGA